MCSVLKKRKEKKISNENTGFVGTDGQVENIKVNKHESLAC